MSVLNYSELLEIALPSEKSYVFFYDIAKRFKALNLMFKRASAPTVISLKLSRSPVYLPASLKQLQKFLPKRFWQKAIDYAGERI